jgi:hypothetical protein
VRLFWYDDSKFPATSYYSSDSLDGIHFNQPTTAFTLPVGSGPGPGIRVQYSHSGTTNIYLALTVLNDVNQYTYAQVDGSAFSPIPTNWTRGFTPIGQSTTGNPANPPANYAAPGYPTIVSDRYGYVDLTQQVVIFSGEYPIGTVPWFSNVGIYRISGQFIISP